jgi:hypothetical protein
MILRTALGLILCAAIPASATTAYMITSAEQFGTVNLSTGAFTFLGTTQVGSTPEPLQGLGEAGGVLYGGGGANDDTLYSINTANGSLTSIGASATIDYAGFGSTLSGLYALSTTGGLYSVNPTNGATTLIGLNVTNGGTLALSTGSSTLYLAEFFNSAYNLYTLNTTTGAATLVGLTSTAIGALMWDGVSTLYGGQDTPFPLKVDTLSTSNGSVTTGPGLTGSSSNFGGFAPLLTTPEPATWSFLGTGIGILALMKYRIRKRADRS